MSDLYARYDEIMSYREEAVRKYSATAYSIKGPPTIVALPTPMLHNFDGLRGKRLGPIFVADRPPVASHVERYLRERSQPVTVLEIGPGRGDLARHLLTRYRSGIAHYYGLERDEAVSGPYERIDSVNTGPTEIDLVIAAEVIEHMHVQVFYDSILEPLIPRMRRDGTAILSLPNPTAPGGIARDFTHVQNYPWYDLYAILRLAFEDVQIFRVHYIFNIKRFAMLVPRYLIAAALELEWCDQLVAVAGKPILTNVTDALGS